MWWYNAGIFLYGLGLQIASPFHAKARSFLKGRSDLFPKLTEWKDANPAPVAWFHCASLGEFEQCRPVLEEFSLRYPSHKILLTFFSPSGFEVRKNYAKADLVSYLPLDTPANARKFIGIVKPQVIFFVKYEFWYNLLKTAHESKIPALAFSTIFREDQIFFKPKGRKYAQVLHWFRKIFVQNQSSLDLLKSAGVKQAEIAGDTRFDRVLEIAASPLELPEVKTFVGQSSCLVIGSSWEEDAEVLLPLINSTSMKVIIAPHEIRDESLLKLTERISRPLSRYTRGVDPQTDVLLVDTIGILSSLYQFATISYVGGGFGKGLHNILEASVYGMPCIFGNKAYVKFQEALDLIDLGAAYPVSGTEELLKTVDYLTDHLGEFPDRIHAYFNSRAGATKRIMNYVDSLKL